MMRLSTFGLSSWIPLAFEQLEPANILDFLQVVNVTFPRVHQNLSQFRLSSQKYFKSLLNLDYLPSSQSNYSLIPSPNPQVF